MKVIVGSTNPVKIDAVRLAFTSVRWFGEFEMGCQDVSSGVADQPKSLEETVRGAINRAEAAFNACDYGVGVEAGLMTVPHTESGYMNVTVCAIYDGNKSYLGLSSAFELPKKINALIKKNIELKDAMCIAGYTTNTNLHREGGTISILTNGALRRQEYTMQAVIAALAAMSEKFLN